MSQLHDHLMLRVRAERRHGLLITDDLLAAQVGPTEAARWLASGRLVRQARGVYRVGGCPWTRQASILAAVLVHGSHTWASHRTAAWLWGLPGFGPPGRVELTRISVLSNQRSAATVHRTTRMLDHHHGMLDAIPVTSLPRTVFDLAGSLGVQPLGRVAECALRTRNCTIGALYRTVEELGGRGRRGTVAMRSILAERGAHYVPTESELDLLGRAVVDAIPGIEWQVSLGDEQGYIRRVDGLHRLGRLVIEWDGAQFHDSFEQRALDAANDRKLEGLGFRVVRYRWSDVTTRPAEVRREVATLVTGQEVGATQVA